MKIITQALVAAWLAKNAKELEVLPGDEAARTAVVAEALGAAVPYFESHAERESFLITTDGQAFYDDEANQHIAAQHALSLKEPNLKIVLRVHRSDVQEVLNAEKGAATLKAEATGNDYGSMTPKALKELCDEKGITYNDKTTKAQLIQLLLDSVGKVAVETELKNAEADGIVKEGIEVAVDGVTRTAELNSTDAKKLEQVTAEVAPINYEALTVKELTAEAEKLGIIVVKGWNKAQLIEAIKTHIAAAEKAAR